MTSSRSTTANETALDVRRSDTSNVTAGAGVLTEARPHGAFVNRECGTQKPAPLFIIGMPRSGTSWLGKIFDRHPMVLYRLEPDSIDRRGSPPFLCLSDAVVEHRERTREYLNRMADVRTSKCVGSPPFFPKAYRNSVLDRLRHGFILGLKGMERLGIAPDFWRAVAIPDFADRGAPVILVMKSIESVGRVNLYRSAWPDCRVIFIIRHPCGQVASVKEGIERQKFTSRTPIFDNEHVLGRLVVSDQARRHGLTLKRLKAMSPIERLAWMWAVPNEKAMQDAASDPNVRIIRYCDLCRDPMSEARKLFEFARISWHPEVESFLRVSTDPQRAESNKYYSVFRDPELSVDRWRSILTADEVAAIHAQIKETAPAKLFHEW